MRFRLERAIKAASIVTLAEARAGALHRNWGDKKLQDLESHLSSFLQVGIDLATAEIWARLHGWCLKKGRKKPQNDLWIAATALQYDYVVASLDNHFSDMPSIKLLDATGIERKNPDE